MLHELAHTRHLNHSARFWALLARLDPECARHDEELAQAWTYIPPWLGC